MKSQKTPIRASTAILGLAAALFLSVGCDDSTASDPPITPADSEAQPIPTAPGDHGHAH